MLKERVLLNKPTSQRNTNLELFRIICMFLIVVHHYVVNSGMTAEMAKDPLATNSLFFYLAGAWGKTGINCFMLITGYFMCKSHITLRKFVKLILQIEFYKIAIYFIFALSGYTTFSFASLLNSVILVRVVSDEFISTFILFFLFIPFLNVLLQNINEKMHLRLVFLCLFLYTFIGTVPTFSVRMNYVSWFISIYFISAYIRLYPKTLFGKTKLWGVATLISLAASAISVIIFLKTNQTPYYLVSDSNKVLAVTTSVFAFLFFKNVKIPYIKVINLIASAAFGVLLIHANSDTMRQWLWKDTLQNAVVFHTSSCYLHFAVSVVAVYSICTVIDLLRLY